MPTADKVVVELEAKTGGYDAAIRRSAKQFDENMGKTEKSARDAQIALKRAFADSGQDEFKRAMSVIRNAANRTEEEVSRAADTIARNLSERYNQMGQSVGQTLAGISRASAVAFGAITAYSLKLASDAGEIESAFGVAFGSATEDVKGFSEQLAETAGRDAVVLRESMTRLQLVLTGTGVAARDAAELVKSLSTAGVDAGSLFNTSDAEALQKIISGLTGEAEPLKAFGVVINEAAVKAELLRLGFVGNAEAATEAQKSIARANLILKGLAVAQGDAARTADSAANTTKRMTAEFNKAARDLGTELLPAMTKLFGAATDVLKAFNDLPGGVQIAGLAFLGLIAAGGPIAGLIAGLARVIKLANETRLALIAAGAAGAGGGAAAAASGAILPVAAAVGTLSLSGSSERVINPQTVSDPSRRLQEVTRERAALVSRGPGRSNTSRSGYTTTLRALDAQIVILQERVDLRNGLLELARAPETESSEPETEFGNFSLGSLSGGANRAFGARRGGGLTAAEINESQRLLLLQVQINRARAEGRDAEVRAAQKQLDVAALKNQLDAVGIENAQSRAEAEIEAVYLAEDTRAAAEDSFARTAAAVDLAVADQERLNEGLRRELELQLELARLAGDEQGATALQRRLDVLDRRQRYGVGNEAAADRDSLAVTSAEDAARERDLYRGYAAEFVDVLRSGNIWESLGQRFADAAANNLESILADILQAIFSANSNGGGGSGVGNTLANVASAIFSGRANGGPVQSGRAYLVGDRTRLSDAEIFRPGVAGSVTPLRGLNGGGKNITIKQGDIYITGQGDAALRAYVQQSMLVTRQQTLADVRNSAPSEQLENRLLRE